MPCKFRTAKQLVSHNIHSSTYNYKYTFSVEIVPVCKVRRFECLVSRLAALAERNEPTAAPAPVGPDTA